MSDPVPSKTLPVGKTALTRALLGLEGESAIALGQALQDVVRSIRVHLGMDVAFISEFTGGRRVFRQIDAGLVAVPIEAGGGGPLEESYCQRIVDGRLPQLIHNAQELPAALELAATRAVPVGAHLSVPICFSDGSVYGTLCCFSLTANYSLNERDLGMMKVLADFTAHRLEQDASRQHDTEAIRERIERVLETRDYNIVYQPIIHVPEHRIIGYEALTRFSPEPYRTPDVWFHEAALAGLQAELEIAVIARALEAMPLLPGNTYMSLNVSPATLMRSGIAEVLERGPLNRLVLEITEHESIIDYEAFARALTPLRQHGLALAVDDAGAGYASFRHILRLKPDIIKLDISLTQGIDQDPARRALAVALIQFAAETGSKIVAEGVEKLSELEVLRQLKVNKAQGYLLGRPAPASRLQTSLQ
ncbi:EAL domain-containing protein [Azoarcus sp. TTM-91]|uniref:sensor domain-containing phosphodiesterase n=1 Tax=Azoarcus sp. TTM-91 TaxID=2691581 RepID=UPI00145CFB46|nr:EAL domain-containing protein [Azoarcus sp. TTM-91]NMG36361.1 EAL domain-containing protein [Azoarcus sp. TTM-91]